MCVWNGITCKFLEVFKVILFEIVIGHLLNDLAVVNYFRKKNGLRWLDIFMMYRNLAIAATTLDVKVISDTWS